MFSMSIMSGMTELPSDLPALFTGRHFDRLLIIQPARWYTTFKLSSLKQKLVGTIPPVKGIGALLGAAPHTPRTFHRLPSAARNIAAGSSHPAGV